MGIDETWKKDQELLQGAAVLRMPKEEPVKEREQTVDYKAAKFKFKNRNMD